VDRLLLIQAKTDWSTDMLGLDNPIHILFLLILLLLVFGAKRLPEMGRSLGSGMRGFKESLHGDIHEPVELAQPLQTATAPIPGEHVRTAGPGSGESTS
jgi:sec-independent protein translocase protein TatA